MANKKLAEQVTNLLIAVLKANRVPWACRYGLPRNIHSQYRYGGINPLLLNVAAQQFGYKSIWWGTPSQWSMLGGRLAKDAQSHMVVSYKKEKGLLGAKRTLKSWDVFNVNQVD